MAEELRETLDLSGRGLKKVEVATEEGRTVSALVLDHNDLQRLENLDSYVRLESLSVSNNFLLRMHGVSKLTNLRVLCLNNNGILQIEGLKDMIYLRTLKLSGNNIKSIEHLNHNTHLEHLDLSNNQISFVADISYLKNLKYLSVERNRVVDLRQCERLPAGLTHLGLAHNNIRDLTEVAHLSHLTRLDSITLQGNPCVLMAGKDKLGFDYRPFVINWIMSVKSIDGFVISAIDSLKAEWLYSQGKGRSFRTGQHDELCVYLAATCPLTADALETDEQRKLRLILSKAQHHQMQLKDQTNSPVKSKLQSPRMQSRISSRSVGKSPDRLSTSYHPAMSRSNCLSDENPMSMSCSGDITCSTSSGSLPPPCHAPPCHAPPCHEPPGANVRHDGVQGDGFTNGGEAKSAVMTALQPATKAINQPLEAASKMVPVPESLMSPDYHDPMFDLHRTIPRPTRPQLNTSNSSHNSGSPRDIHDAERVNNKSLHQMNACNKSKGSPKATRSAISSPKLRSKVDPQRKGSLTKLDFKSMSNSNESINKSLANGKVVKGEDSEMSADKLQGIRAASQRRLRRASGDATVRAAVTIQKMWRGYRSRNLHKETMRILHAIQAARARQHIQRLTCDMEATKAALDSERKIQQLQMQAINALWKKVSALQSADTKANGSESEEKNEMMRQLTETCFSLQTQVVELRSSMQEMVRAVSSLRSGSRPAPAPAPVATQTDITAVNTPQEERCSWLRRPQSLALSAPSAPAQPPPARPLPPPAPHLHTTAEPPRDDQGTDTEQESLVQNSSFSVSEQEGLHAGERGASRAQGDCEDSSEVTRQDSDTPCADRKVRRVDSEVPRADSEICRSDGEYHHADREALRTDIEAPDADTEIAHISSEVSHSAGEVHRADRVAPRADSEAPRVATVAAVTAL